VRRPGEQLRVHWVSDFCHPRWEVDLVKADAVVDVFTPVGVEAKTVRATVKKLKADGFAKPTHHQVATEIGVRSADVARWLESTPEILKEFGWLDRSRREPGPAIAIQDLQDRKPVERRPPREPVPDELLVRMRELLPIGTRVTNTYDRNKQGVVVEYRRERGLPKFLVEWSDGSRSAFPRNLLTFATQVA